MRTISAIGAAVAAVLLALFPVAPAAAAGHGGVLVVGDSLEELTSPYLARYLPGVPLTVNAVGGSNSYQIRELFEESYDPSQSVIVFDAGTNDNPAYPQILAENLTRVAAAIGERCMVVPTIHGLTVDGIDSSGKNRVVREFAASRPGTQVPDWARAEKTHPELMQPDDLHPTAAGAELRAQLIARGVRGCLVSGPTAPARRGPILSSQPSLIPRPDRMARREAEVVRALAAEIARRTAARLLMREASWAFALGAAAMARPPG
jgi:GDSL-like lipase/acylhydrolase family protein